MPPGSQLQNTQNTHKMSIYDRLIGRKSTRQTNRGSKGNFTSILLLKSFGVDPAL